MAERDLFPLKELQPHRDLLERASWHFQGDKRVTGLMLWGSITRGHPDQFSDVDLVAVAPDSQFGEVFADRDRTAQAIGQPLACYLADHVPGGETQFMVLYPGPIQLDLTYRRASEMKPEREWATSHIIKDRDGSLLKLKTASEQLESPEGGAAVHEEEILKLDAKFWNCIWNAYGRIERGELWEELRIINHLRDFAIMQAQDWILKGSLEGYRRIESRLPDDLAPKFAATVALCEAESLSRALFAEIALYSELRDRLSERAGISIENRAERHVLDAISERAPRKHQAMHSRRTK